MRPLIEAAQCVHRFQAKIKSFTKKWIKEVKSVCNKLIVWKPSIITIIKDASYCDYKVKEWKESESKRVKKVRKQKSQKVKASLIFHIEDNVIKEYKCCRELNSFIKLDSISKQ